MIYLFPLIRLYIVLYHQIIYRNVILMHFDAKFMHKAIHIFIAFIDASVHCSSLQESMICYGKRKCFPGTELPQSDSGPESSSISANRHKTAFMKHTGRDYNGCRDSEEERSIL